MRDIVVVNEIVEFLVGGRYPRRLYVALQTFDPKQELDTYLQGSNADISNFVNYLYAARFIDRYIPPEGPRVKTIQL